jgi:hypothetical protein
VNLELVSRITARLRSSAVIGAFALAARGFIRHTSDFDLLTLDTRSLDPHMWDDLRQEGFDVDVRKGDFDDPLAGVVRIKTTDASIDVIVGKDRWQQAVIDRAETMKIEGASLRIPLTSDLILLKLFAGGYGDLNDIDRLLAIGTRDALVGEVGERLRELPPKMTARWQKLLAAR